MLTSDHLTRVTEWEYNGVTFKPYDRIYITGITGKFTFRYYEKNAKTGKDYVCVYREGYHHRFFDISRIKIKKIKQVKVKNKVTFSVCVEHPKYTAQRKPRTGCARCIAAYESRKT